jgi:hypothetical protein
MKEEIIPIVLIIIKTVKTPTNLKHSSRILIASGQKTFRVSSGALKKIEFFLSNDSEK